MKTGWKGSAVRYFNPRAPCGARLIEHFKPLADEHFNPRAPCGARLNAFELVDGGSNFNPRAPCGARLRLGASCVDNRGFQSTRPMRGATVGLSGILSLSPYFNPRAPCGARRKGALAQEDKSDFNPRAPCGARPASRVRHITGGGVFQSTRPMRGATAKVYKITLNTFATKGNS